MCMIPIYIFGNDEDETLGQIIKKPYHLLAPLFTTEIHIRTRIIIIATFGLKNRKIAPT